MKDFTPVKKLALYSAATVMCVAGSSAFAHTGIRDKVTEGVSGYNALTVTHGCNGNVSLGAKQNVIALSAVFPNAADPALAKVYKLTPAGIQIEPALDDLSGHIVDIGPGEGFTTLGLGLVTGGGTLFANIIPTVDSTGVIRGYRTWSGPTPYLSAPLQESIVSATGLSPFRYGAIKFETTSCAKSLKVRVAIANWCKKGSGTQHADDRVDVWMGHTTAVFHDQKTMPRATPYNAATEVPFWPTMTVNRNLATNPLPAADANGVACAGGFDLAIEPADADIDANLPIPTAKYPLGAGANRYYN